MTYLPARTLPRRHRRRDVVDNGRHTYSGQDDMHVTPRANALRGRTSRPLDRPGPATVHVSVSVCLRVCVWSVEAAAAQVVGDDDVSDGVKDELDVGGVGGARLVTVDLLRRALVLRLELRLDVRCRLLVRLRT